MKISKFQTISSFSKWLLLVYIYFFISTEALSFFHLLKREYILGFDFIFLVFILWRFKKEIYKFLTKIKFLFSKKSYLVILMLLVLTFVQGLLSAPNTTDSMVYHLPRVMYWRQENCLFQNVLRSEHDYTAPFAEYILLHLYSISDTDRLLFLSQWVSYLALICMAWIISRQLGAKVETADKSALIVALLPIAVMQATSTQVDLLTAVFVLITLHLSLIMMNDSISLKNSLLLGFSIGLGALTKATYAIFLVIPLGVLGVSLLKNKLKGLGLVVLAGLVSLLIQVRFIIQNMRLFGTPIGRQAGGKIILVNEYLNLGVLVSNFVRNIMIHIPVLFFTNYAQLAIERLHNLLNLSVNSPATTCCGFLFKVNSVIYPQEDIVGNPLHLVLIFIAGFVVFKKKKLGKDNLVNLVYSLSILSILIFGAVLKWQPFLSRMHIPFFMMGSIAAVLLLNKFKKGSLFVSTIIALSIPLAFILIIFNVSHPYLSYNFFYDRVKIYSPPLASIPTSFLIKPRLQQYFNARSYWYTPYQKVVNKLVDYSGYKRIRFNLMDEFEYPLWKLLKDKNISAEIVPKDSQDLVDFIITTSKELVVIENYQTECIKTEVDYGYVCLSKKII